MNELVITRIKQIEKYLDDNGTNSYDPYDGLSSPLLNSISHDNQLISRIFQQAIRLFPLNVRPLIGIKKINHTKTISDLASANLILFSSTNEENYRNKGIMLLDNLLSNRSYSIYGYGWGLRFPFATRFVMADYHTSNIFQTINAIHSFLDGFSFLHDIKYLEIASKGFEYIKMDIGFNESADEIIWNYWPGLDVPILNVNGLMIGLCARMWESTKDESYKKFSEKTYNYVKKQQNSDGSWYYSVDDRGKFIDGFHTGYILEGLCRATLLNIIPVEETIKKGMDFYLKQLFTKDCIPKYFDKSLYPIDVQNMAQALQTLFFLFKCNLIPIHVVNKCFTETDKLLWNKKGYYNYYKSRIYTNTIPMHRWGTGPMLLALSNLQTIPSSNLNE